MSFNLLIITSQYTQATLFLPEITKSGAKVVQIFELAMKKMHFFLTWIFSRPRLSALYSIYSAPHSVQTLNLIKLRG